MYLQFFHCFMGQNHAHTLLHYSTGSWMKDQIFETKVSQNTIQHSAPKTAHKQPKLYKLINQNVPYLAVGRWNNQEAGLTWTWERRAAQLPCSAHVGFSLRMTVKSHK